MTGLHITVMQLGRLFYIGYLLLNTYALTVQINPSRLQNSVLPDWPFSVEKQYPLTGVGGGKEDFNLNRGRLSDNGLSNRVQWFVVPFSYYAHLFYPI